MEGPCAHCGDCHRTRDCDKSAGQPPGDRAPKTDALEARINALTKKIAKLEQQVAWLQHTAQQQYDTRTPDWTWNLTNIPLR
jgi:hypothetical protein